MATAAVIPGYNEEEAIQFVIKEAGKYVDEVFYVDDGSTDRTPKVAEEVGAEVIRFRYNRGKGSALRTGILIALRKEFDKIVTLDSDGQHDPAYIPNLLKALEDADLVIGSRYAGRFYTIPRNVLGNFGLNFITNFLSYGPQGLLRHKWLGDTQSGFRAFKAEALKQMDLEARSYAIESEMVYEAAVNEIKVEEIPIRVPVRARGVGIRDGLRNAVMVFKKRFNL